VVELLVVVLLLLLLLVVLAVVCEKDDRRPTWVVVTKASCCRAILPASWKDMALGSSVSLVVASSSRIAAKPPTSGGERWQEAPSGNPMVVGTEAAVRQKWEEKAVTKRPEFHLDSTQHPDMTWFSLRSLLFALQSEGLAFCPPPLLPPPVRSSELSARFYGLHL